LSACSVVESAARTVDGAFVRGSHGHDGRPMITRLDSGACSGDLEVRLPPRAVVARVKVVVVREHSERLRRVGFVGEPQPQRTPVFSRIPVVQVSALGVVHDGADDLRRDRPLFRVRLVVLEDLLFRRRA